MNKANLIKLIDHLKALPDDENAEVGFNMAQYYVDNYERGYKDHSGHNCGTVACIAGHVYEMSSASRTHPDVSEQARRWLDISHSEAGDLFELCDYDLQQDMGEITLDQAIVTLEKLRDTGEIDWSHVSRKFKFNDFVGEFNARRISDEQN